LVWLKKIQPFLTGFGWNPNFWIYLILFIYLFSALAGIYEFFMLSKLYKDSILYKDKNLIDDIDSNPNIEMQFST
jgi:hypothetical protein